MIVSDGFYSVYYNYWKTFFGKNLLLVDGTGILKNPALEIIKIQKFLGLDVQVNEDYFVFDEERDFYCLKNRCMKSSKGRSKGRNFPPEIHDKLKKLYKPFDDDIQVKFCSLLTRSTLVQFRKTSLESNDFGCKASASTHDMIRSISGLFCQPVGLNIVMSR